MRPSGAPSEEHAKRADAGEGRGADDPHVVDHRATEKACGDRADEHEQQKKGDLGGHKARESSTGLVSVYDAPDAQAVLYALLEERDGRADMNISHRAMPTWEEHVAFVASRPYEAWYLLETDGDVAGSVYLSRAREVGIFLFAKHQAKGLGEEAIRLLREKHPGRLLANVNPANERSRRFFERLGFRVVQVTYAQD